MAVSKLFAVGKILTISNTIKLMLLLGVFALFGVIVQSCKGPADTLARFSTASLKKLVSLENPPARPNTVFKTLSGEDVILSDYQGKVVLLNAWATWCPPCIAEMPSLERLQTLRGGEDFIVVPISLDRTPEDAALWLAENDITALTSWHDASYGLPGMLNLSGLPTSVLYNGSGRELARVKGEVVWDSPEALALIDYFTAQEMPAQRIPAQETPTQKYRPKKKAPLP